MPHKFLMLLILLASAMLSACGATASRAADAAPLEQTVAEQGGVPVAQPEAPAPENVAAATVSEPVVRFNINSFGFCDELTIAASGDYVLNSCTHGQISGTLKPSDKASLEAWVSNLSSFDMSAADAPNATDELDVALSFVGQGSIAAPDDQKLVLYDWVNGLVASLQPRPEIELGLESVPVAVGGLCNDIPRPALVMLDFEQPGVVSLLNADSMATCDIQLAQPPFGRILTAGDSLYYPVANADAQTVTLWQFNAAGEQSPLEFTQLSMEEPTPHGFIVADDGSKIAWSQTVLNYETDPPTYSNYLWLANSDGSGQQTILDGVENDEQRFALPIRFSTADHTLFYALQPDIGGPVLSGRFDNLYRVTAGGEAEQVYVCADEENPVCIAGLAQDGSAFTVLQPADDTLQVMNLAGELLNAIPLPGTDYVERTAFGPNGSLAFMSATFSEPVGEEASPMPNPGYITVLAAPYTGEAETLLSDNSVGGLWGWLDDSRLVYGTLDEAGNPGTAVVALDGTVTEISSKFAAALLK